MDIPRYLADWIKDLSGGLRVEAEPSDADIDGDRFVVSVTSLWMEPAGMTSNLETGNYTYEQDGVPIELYMQALPVRVVWKSRGTGELWRGQQIEQTRRNAIMFSGAFKLPIFGGRYIGEAAKLLDDGVGKDVVNFQQVNNDGPGLGMSVGLRRDIASDKFEKDTSSYRSRGQTRTTERGYVAEQHFVGEVSFIGGAEVPNDNRRRA